MILPTACLFLFFSVVAIDAGAPPVAEKSPSRPAASVKEVVGPTLAETLSRIDSLHGRRDDRSALAQQRQMVDGSVAHWGGDYGVLWRAARCYFWISDDPSLPNDQRSKLGKIGWDLAERAIVVNPNQGEGYYWAAVNMGNYALGLGVVKALTMGMEKNFKGRLERAGQLIPGYQYGGVDVAWGRFYEKLPWPKRDRTKAEQHLRRVLTHWNGNNLRARVFLADTLSQDGRAPEAKKLLDEVAAATPGRYDAPEERRAKALGVGLMPSVIKRMN